MPHLSLWKQGLLLTGASLFLAGCMVGPNFHSPHIADPNPPDDKPNPTTKTATLSKAGIAQTFSYDTDLPGKWWQLFHSTKINQLIDKGLSHNPNLAAAKATLTAAQETLFAQAGSTLLPSLNGSFTGSRQNNTALATTMPGGANNAASIYNLFNTSIKLSYTLDIFGGYRRQVEALVAQADYQAFQLEAAYLSLTSNIATTAITIASLQAQLQTKLALLATQEEQLAILAKQYKMGGVAKTTVTNQKILVAQTQASLTPLKQQLATNQHTLAILVGEAPTQPDSYQFDLNSLRLPPRIPLALPSTLAKQRPDVRAAEATLHAASAQIGVATANLYPQFNISANDGWQALTLNKLFHTATKSWAWGSALSIPVFNGGSLLANRRAAVASYQSAHALYQQTVLQALKNVADSLQVLRQDADNLRAFRQAEVDSEQNYAISHQQYRLGGASYLDVLSAKQQYQTTQSSRIIAQASRLADTVALFQSLGGGWWQRPPLAENPVLAKNVAGYR